MKTATKTPRLSSVEKELARYDALPTKLKILAMAQLSKPARDTLLNRARASFKVSAKLKDDFVTYSTSEILYYVEALNFNVEKKSDFKTVFANLRGQDLPNSFAAIGQIADYLKSELLATKQKNKAYTATIREKIKLTRIVDDGIEREATLNDVTYFDLANEYPAKSDLYFYNSATNDYLPMATMRPIIEAYHMVADYQTNIAALIEARKAQKALDAEYGATA